MHSDDDCLKIDLDESMDTKLIAIDGRNVFYNVSGVYDLDLLF